VSQDSTSEKEIVFRKTWKLIRSLDWNKKVLYGALIFVVVLFSLLNPRFLSVSNLINIVQQIAILTVVAVGTTFTIICGEIDLSVGSIVGLSAMTTALAVSAGGGFAGGLAAGLCTGAVVGFINGFITTKADVPSFLITLGMMGLARGLAMTITEGYPVLAPSDTLINVLNSARIFSVPVAIFWMLFVIATGHFLLSLTKFGRHLYATGGNRISTMRAGINTNAIRSMSLVLSGSMAGFAGVLYTARFHAARGTIGEGMELEVIAAIILGGTSLQGGKGSIFGTFQGAILIGALTTGLLMVGLGPYWQMAFRGLMIIVAVSIGGGWIGSRRKLHLDRQQF
jgi:ribose transport system permease protein